MNSAKPPRLAAWILEHFGPELHQEALAGDLNEALAQGRSSAWYWRQVLAAARWRRLLYPLLISALMGCLLTSRPIDIPVFTAVYFASLLIPGMMRGRSRILLALLIVAIFGLLWHYQHDLADHYWILFWTGAFNFAFYSEKPAVDRIV